MLNNFLIFAFILLFWFLIIDAIIFYGKFQDMNLFSYDPYKGIFAWLDDFVFYRFRYFFIGIRNIVKWIPVIYHDRDWDNYFIYKILKKKIYFIRKRLEKLKPYAGYENEIKYMKICEKLLDYLIKADAWTDEEMKKPLNVENIKLNKQLISIYTNKDSIKSDRFDHININDLYRAELRECKVSDLFWKIMMEKVAYWWD